MPPSDATLAQISEELKNFEDIARAIKPRSGSIPSLEGIDVYGEILPLNGIVGGDHLIYMDFKKRYDLEARIALELEAGRMEIVENLRRSKRMAGIAVIDVSGHQSTDAMLAAMVHQAFLMGALYELDIHGQITKKLFENLNTRLCRSCLVNKFVTTLYGEISDEATFRFLSAAHPAPLVFSAAENRFMDVGPELCTTFPPLGTMPSEQDIDRTRTQSVLGFKGKYTLNEWKLMGSGDILFLYTDGLSEHARGNELYFPGRLEDVFRSVKGRSSREIVTAVKEDLLAFAEPGDDITLVAIKRA